MKVAANTLVSAVARTLGLVLAFFSLGIATRYLGLGGAGEYFTVLAYAGIFNVFADLGLYQTLLRDIAHADSNKKGGITESSSAATEASVFSDFLSLRAFSLILVLGIIAPLIATFLPYSRAVKFGIIIGSLIFICQSLTTLFIAIFQKYLRMQIVAMSELLARGVQAALVFILLTHGHGLVAALFAVLAGSVAQLAVLALFARSHISYRFSVNFGAWKSIIRASYPIALSAIFSFIYFKIDTLMISLFKTSYDVGVYGLAYKLLEILVAYPSIYVGLLVPALALAAISDRNGFHKIMQQAFDVLVFVAIPLFFGGAALSYKIIALFGPGYSDAAPTLVILLGAVVAIFFGTLYSNALIAAHKQSVLAKVYFWGMVLNIAANLYAIPRWSYFGAATTTLLTEAGVTIAMIAALKKEGLLSAKLSRLPAIFAAGLIMYIVLNLAGRSSLLVLLPAGVAVYGVCAFAFKAISRSELVSALKPEQT